MKQATGRTDREGSTTDNLIALGVVIACGCVECTETLVVRALEAGCSSDDIRKVISVIRYMRTVDCLTARISSETLAGMEQPLGAAATALKNWPASGKTAPRCK